MRKDKVTNNYHGTIISDPYRWLEVSDSPVTEAWCEEQNRVTREFLTSKDQVRIKGRLQHYFNFPRYGLPKKASKHYFYNYNQGLKNQPVLYARYGLHAEPKVVIDPNQLSTDGSIALTSFDCSPDGRFMAYALSEKGSDWQKILIRDVDKGADYPEEILHTRFTSMAWTPKGEGFFYSRFPEPGSVKPEDQNNYNRVYYHRRGTPQTEDLLVYERPDAKELSFNPNVSEDGRYLTLFVWCGTDRRNRFYYRPLNNYTPFIRLLDDGEAMYEPIGNIGSVFYFHTDHEAPRGRVIAIDVENSDRDKWREIIPENKDVISQVKLVGGKLVIAYTHHAHHKLKLFNLEGGLIKDIELPDMGTITGMTGKSTDHELFISFSAFLYPEMVYHYDFNTDRLAPFAEEKVPFNREDYQTKQVFYKTLDGTEIPMFITCKKDLELDGNKPTILYGYGGFNISMTPVFAPTMLPWLEQGGIYAVACLRGGGEYGEEWHKAGMLANKQNVFDDFIAAAEWLINNDYTRSDLLAIMGGSNGGLLVAACMVQRPQLFGAVICRVPVIDMLRYHKFTVGRYWIPEYGNAEENPEHFQFLFAYSPLHNIKEGTRYPPTLIMTADTDDRVVPGHALKFTATLQEKGAGTNPVLLRVETKAGHGAGKPVTKIIEESADIYAFLHRVMAL